MQTFGLFLPIAFSCRLVILQLRIHLLIIITKTLMATTGFWISKAKSIKLALLSFFNWRYIFSFVIHFVDDASVSIPTRRFSMRKSRSSSFASFCNAWTLYFDFPDLLYFLLVIFSLSCRINGKTSCCAQYLLWSPLIWDRNWRAFPF